MASAIYPRTWFALPSRFPGGRQGANIAVHACEHPLALPVLPCIPALAKAYVLRIQVQVKETPRRLVMPHCISPRLQGWGDLPCRVICEDERRIQCEGPQHDQQGDLQCGLKGP